MELMKEYVNMMISHDSYKEIASYKPGHLDLLLLVDLQHQHSRTYYVQIWTEYFSHVKEPMLEDQKMLCRLRNWSRVNTGEGVTKCLVSQPRQLPEKK